MNIFCTRKTETFIKVLSKREVKLETFFNWQCHLIAIGGKKSLFFIEKKTLYSVMLINIQKKDLIHIQSLFFQEFINQLKADQIYFPEIDSKIKNFCDSIVFFETDNDQKTLGTLRDLHYHIKNYTDDKTDKLEAANYFMKSSINNYPLASKKFSYAKDNMAFELNNLT